MQVFIFVNVHIEAHFYSFWLSDELMRMSVIDLARFNLKNMQKSMKPPISNSWDSQPSGIHEGLGWEPLLKI